MNTSPLLEGTRSLSKNQVCGSYILLTILFVIGSSRVAVIRFYTMSQGWTADDVKSQIIDVYKEQEVSNYSDVDLTSIMQ